MYFFHLDRLKYQGIPFPEVEPDEDSDEGKEDRSRDEAGGQGGVGELQASGIDFAEVGIARVKWIAEE